MSPEIVNSPFYSPWASSSSRARQLASGKDKEKLCCNAIIRRANLENIWRETRRRDKKKRTIVLDEKMVRKKG